MPCGSRLLAVEIAAAVVVLAAGHRPAVVVAAAEVAAAVVVLSVSWRDRTLARMLLNALRWRWGRTHRESSLPPGLVIDAVRGRRGSQIGVVEDGTGWVAAVEIPVPAADDHPRQLPLDALTAVVDAADLPVSCAQVVIRLAPAVPAGLGDARTEPLAATGVAVWIAVRVEAADLASADSSGDVLGVTVRRCLDRLTAMLAAAGLRAVPLTVDGLQEAVRLAGGLDAVSPAGDEGTSRPPGHEHWPHFSDGGRAHASCLVTRWPDGGPAALLAAATQVPRAATTVALLVRGGKASATVTGTVRVSTATATDAVQARTALVGAAAARGLRLRPAAGEQLAGLRATLPLARTWQPSGSRSLPLDQLPPAVPIPVSGLRFGSAVGGLAIRLPLLGERPVRVGVLGLGPGAAILVDGLLAADPLLRVVGLHPQEWAALRAIRPGAAPAPELAFPPDPGRLPAVTVAGPRALHTAGPDTGAWQVTVLVHPVPTPEQVATMHAFDVLVLHRLPTELAAAVRRFDGISSAVAERLPQMPPGVVAVVVRGQGRFVDLSSDFPVADPHP